MPPLSVYHYAGWFNIIGRLVADEKEYSRWGDSFEIYPMAEAAAASPAFAAVRSCRLEFEVEVPWVLPNTDQSRGSV
jgi:hypothetical protein